MGDMTRLLLLLLWVGVAVSTPVDVQKRIIGGTKCGDKERQYHVVVEGYDGNEYFLCGGSLISDSWILTSAHCEETTITAYLGFHPNGPVTEQVITDPPVIFTENSNKHDIMLLKLPKSTKIDPKTKDIDPVKLPDCKKIPALGDTVQTAGVKEETLGHKNKRVPGKTDTLLCVDLEIVADSVKVCTKNAYGKEYGKSDFKLFQAPNKDKDISPGDSGGGVVYNGMIYGVNAFGHETYGCVVPSGFVNVCKYQTWIESTAGVTFPK